ncbi:MAG: DUF4276 family protein [Chloroflexi bacterium]|nr:DUF4276 family protein [Chloroflexota bacterium]
MRVLVLVEGPTERAIIDNVFAPDLGLRDIFLYPRVVGKPGHKGGNNFAHVRKELTALIKQEPDSIVTMLFDYYGLDSSWPGVSESKGESADNALMIIKRSIADAIMLDMGPNFNSARFIPYVQFFEIESLLFAGPDEMARVFDKPNLETIFKQIVTDCGGCEKINDNYDTAPSNRIRKHFPRYKKGRGVNAQAWRIAQHIGVERIRKQCPKFNQWFTSLERLGT